MALSVHATTRVWSKRVWRIAEEVRKDEDGGHEEDELTCEGEEDALLGVADALEERRGNDLDANNGEHHHEATEGMGRHADEFGRVLGKERSTRRGEERADEKASHGHHGGNDECMFQHAYHTVVALGAEVVAGNGLHALVQTDDHHHDEEYQTVANAEGAYGHVATVGRQATRHHGCHKTGAKIDEKLWKSHEQRLADDFLFRMHDALVEVNHVVLVAEEVNLPAEHAELGKDGGECRTAYAPPHDEDEHGG